MGTYLGARTNPLRTLLLPPFAVGNMVSLQSGYLFSSVEDLSIAAGRSELEGTQRLVSALHVGVYVQVSTLAMCMSSC